MAAETAERHIAWESHEGPCVAHANGYDIIHCEMCGFRHAVPLPTPESLTREYEENYYSEEKPTFLTHAGEDQDWAELAQNDRLESFERLVGPGRRRLLDIGSGAGVFLKNREKPGLERHRRRAVTTGRGACARHGIADRRRLLRRGIGRHIRPVRCG